MCTRPYVAPSEVTVPKGDFGDLSDNVGFRGRRDSVGERVPLAGSQSVRGGRCRVLWPLRGATHPFGDKRSGDGDGDEEHAGISLLSRSRQAPHAEARSDDAASSECDRGSRHGGEFGVGGHGSAQQRADGAGDGRRAAGARVGGGHGL